MNYKGVLILDSQTNTNRFTNANTHLLTLKRETNGLLTDHTNANHIHFTKSLQLFYDRAKSICTIEQRLFSCEDFQLSKTNFRHKILELKPYIVKVVDGRPSFYKVKGVKLPGDIHLLTLKPTGLDTSQLEKMLLNCKDQPPMLHDIRFKIDSDLHSKLLLKGITPDKNNSCIVINDKLVPSPDSFVNYKLLVYPEHIQLIVGCSLKPLFASIAGIFELTFALGRYIELLRLFVNDQFSIIPVSQWRCVGYHFNKDGTFELNDSNFHYYFEDFQNCMVRIYTKHFPDGTRLRVEKTESCNKPLEQLAREVLEN